MGEKILDLLKDRWLLPAVLIIFILLKFHHLHYPYYWDESWSYLPAVKAMYAHGVSLMPSAMNPDISRGHPLLFYALAAIWMHIFGTSHAALHSFALFISVLLLASTYEICLRLFNRRVAATAILLVATQQMFFVQSSFVLPEILLALLVLLSICFYLTEHYFLTVAALTALFYTKESGMVGAAAIGIDAIVLAVLKTGGDRMALLRRMLSVLLPVLFISTFFIIQKITTGWYFYPGHIQYLETKWDTFMYNLRNHSFVAMFIEDLRYYYFYILCILFIAAAIKNRRYLYLVFILPVGMGYYLAGGDWNVENILSGVPAFILLFASVAALLYSLIRLNFFDNNHQLRFVWIICLFVLLFSCFSAENFFTPRYMLAALVPALLFVAVILDKVLERLDYRLFYPVLLAFLAVSWRAFSTDTSWGDCNMGAFDAMNVQQCVVNYMEEHCGYKQNIGSGANLERVHLTNPETGFLHSKKFFTTVAWDIDHAEYAIFDNIEPDSRYKTATNDPALHLVCRCQKGQVWAEIYQRK